MCCRPHDEAATDWLVATIQNHERLFGQCDNCLENMKRWSCQQVCDQRNVRFIPMALIDDKEETMPAEAIVGQVRALYAMCFVYTCRRLIDLYLLCRSGL